MVVRTRPLPGKIRRGRRVAVSLASVLVDVHRPEDRQTERKHLAEGLDEFPAERVRAGDQVFRVSVVNPVLPAPAQMPPYALAHVDSFRAECAD